MKKLLKTVVSLFLAVMMLTSVFSAASSADKPSEVKFGPKWQFEFKPGMPTYSQTSLFDRFQTVMPGDVLTEYITVSNGSHDYLYVDIYLKALPHDAVNNPLSVYVDDVETVDEMNDFLAQLYMRVWNEGELIYEASPDKSDGLTDYVLLGRFKPDEARKLKVELIVPIEMGNKYMHRMGEVDWVFHAEAFGKISIDDPPEDVSNILTVHKVWDDNDIIRPLSVAVTLFCDGKAYETASLDGFNQWTYTFTNLDPDSEWSVVEHVPSGYSATYHYWSRNLVYITNKEYIPPSGPIDPDDPDKPVDPDGPDKPVDPDDPDKPVDPDDPDKPVDPDDPDKPIDPDDPDKPIDPDDPDKPVDPDDPDKPIDPDGPDKPVDPDDPDKPIDPDDPDKPVDPDDPDKPIDPDDPDKPIDPDGPDKPIDPDDPDKPIDPDDPDKPIDPDDPDKPIDPDGPDKPIDPDDPDKPIDPDDPDKPVDPDDPDKPIDPDDPDKPDGPGGDGDGDGDDPDGPGSSDLPGTTDDPDDPDDPDDSSPVIVPGENGRVTVRKEWAGDEESLENRPELVAVTLMNGTEEYETVWLGEHNGWSYTWKELDPDGKWCVIETEVPKGYTPSYKVCEDGTVVVINTASLIATGVTSWHIPLFAGGGTLLILFGLILILKKRKKEDA